MLLVLFFVNRKLFLSFRGGLRSLSTRYQLVENVRALRLLTPIIILDTLISILDASGSQFFGIELRFEPSKCIRKGYIIAYSAFKSVTLLAEAFVPIAAMRYSSLWKTRKQQREQQTIRNVFGMDIQGQAGDY
ncbi:hypothetical protein V3C99_014147, partial [Haemonchus contortus]